MKQQLFSLFEIITKWLPKKNRAVFLSFAGQYNDNPKYISEELHNQNPEMEVFWLLSNKNKEKEIPPYIHKIKYNSIQAIIVKNTSKVIVSNSLGWHVCIGNLAVKKHLKNKKQLDIATWHGTAYKYAGADAIGNEHWNKNSVFTTADVVLAGNEFVRSNLQAAYFVTQPIHMTGTPRNDILFHHDTERQEQIKKKLQLPSNKRIVVYAPTFRESVLESGIQQLAAMDVERLCEKLSQKFGGEWVFVFRAHNMVQLAIEKEEASNEKKGFIFNGNLGDDMAEYLSVADILITDYSSCMFDFALTYKPCFLFSPDYSKYANEERGVYFKKDETPFPFAQTTDEFYRNIELFNEERYKEEVAVFLNRIGNCETGTAAKQIAAIIQEWLHRNK